MTKKITGQFKKHRVLWMALAGICILLVFSKGLYQYFTKVGEQKPEALQVETIRVKTAGMPEVIDTIGMLTAEKEVTIKAITSGRVQQLLVGSGSFVKQG